MKKIMLLGGNYYQMTAVKAVKELGYYAIDVDYLPNNPAHQYADEYHNISTINKEAVLELAQKLKIDGIVSYASDVSATTAAYVAEKLNLPTNPYEGVMILTHKNLLRKHMENHHFNVPKGKGFKEYYDAYEYFLTLKKPVMIKPVDASGSKGVSKISLENDFKCAYEEALKYSISKNIIVEEFIERDGYQIAGDAFLIDGKVIFAGLMNEHFDKLCNPLVPIGESYPAKLPKKLQEKSVSEIQRLLSTLGMKNGAFNLDFMVTKSGEIYIIEIGPRNGGNLITDTIKCATNIDLAKYTILNAVGMDCSDLIEKVRKDRQKKYYSSYVVHSLADGIYKNLWISDEIKDDIVLSDMFVSSGEKVKMFNHGGFGIGAMIIKHKSMEQMLYRMDNMENFIQAVVAKDGF